MCPSEDQTLTQVNFIPQNIIIFPVFVTFVQVSGNHESYQETLFVVHSPRYSDSVAK